MFFDEALLIGNFVVLHRDDRFLGNVGLGGHYRCCGTSDQRCRSRRGRRHHLMMLMLMMQEVSTRYSQITGSGVIVVQMSTTSTTADHRRAQIRRGRCPRWRYFLRSFVPRIGRGLLVPRYNASPRRMVTKLFRIDILRRGHYSTVFLVDRLVDVA